MTALLAEWDSKAALPFLKARVERCARLVQFGQHIGTRLHGMETGIASLTILRTKTGDPEALNDYAGWVRSVTPDHFSFTPIAMFEPLFRNPDHPAVIAAAAVLFEDPNSPWNASISPQSLETDGGFRLDLLRSSLLGLKSFRVLVLRALTDKTQVGTVEADANGTVTVIQGESKTVSDGEITSVSVASSGENAPPTERRVKSAPSAMPLRVADLVCEQLQQLEGIPRFQKQWPVAKRDQAISACIAYLKQYGERFRENEATLRDPCSRARRSALWNGDPRLRPARPCGVGRRRRPGPGDILARRRRGRGPPLPAVVVPARRPMDEAGSLPQRSADRAHVRRRR